MGFISCILLSDEILLHGRTINGFIKKLKDEIRDCLFSDGFAFSRSKVESEVLAAVRIRIIMKSSKGILLNRKAWILVQAEEVCDMQRLH